MKRNFAELFAQQLEMGELSVMYAETRELFRDFYWRGNSSSGNPPASHHSLDCEPSGLTSAGRIKPSKIAFGQRAGRGAADTNY